MSFSRVLGCVAALMIMATGCSAVATVTMVSAPGEQDAPGLVETTAGAGTDGAAVTGEPFDGIEYEMSAGPGAFATQIDGNATVMGDSPRIPGVPPSQPNRAVTTGSNDAVARTINQTLGGSVTFEWQTLPLDETAAGRTLGVEALVPIGWDYRSVLGASFDAPETMDFFTDIAFDTRCQGNCEPKDWRSEVMDDPELSPFAVVGAVEVLVNQELTNPTGRLVVYASTFGDDPVTAITVARWDDNASRFFQCDAQLHGADTWLWPGFADACVAARADWL